jgi:hypothetical protein
VNTGIDFTYGHEAYDRVGVGSNGYLIVGGSTSAADVQFQPSVFPNPAPPDNLIAPYWTDHGQEATVDGHVAAARTRARGPGAMRPGPSLICLAYAGAQHLAGTRGHRRKLTANVPG